MPDDQSFNPDDPLPQLIAELDQALALMPHLAPLARGWYDAFKQQGFTDTQALYLTATQLTDNDLETP